mgnify:FL=1|tara:strand:- start:21 stop:419 length:399 start_codon:yes stop_codon:yes gene_type:complete
MSFHVREKYLFVEEDFIGHSGGELHWKIECDAIFPNEWKCIARMIMEHETRPFCSAIGIPRGGVELGRHLNEYSTGNHNDPYLICDDVLTTGGSFKDFVDEHFKGKDVIGWCVFARNKPQDWINALFQMPYK